jgi:hypothetical protein
MSSRPIGRSGRQPDLEMIRFMIYTRFGVILCFEYRKLVEDLYVPIFSKSKFNTETWI